MGEFHVWEGRLIKLLGSLNGNVALYKAEIIIPRHGIGPKKGEVVKVHTDDLSTIREWAEKYNQDVIVFEEDEDEMSEM